MQTANVKPNSGTGKVYHKRNARKQERKREPCKKNYSSRRIGNHFLNAKIPSMRLPSLCYEGTELLTQENYQYLADSARNYLKLLGKTLTCKQTSSLGESIVVLYKEFDSKVKEQHVNIEVSHNRLTFVLYDFHKWPDYTLFWLPVSFIRKLSGPIKRIAVSFIHELASSNKMPYLHETDEIDYAIEILEQNIDYDDMDKAELKQYQNLIHSYNKGYIFKYLSSIRKTCHYKNLAKAITRYQPLNDYEKRLIQLFNDGMQFIGNDIPPIMNYEYDWNSEYDKNGYCINLRRQICVVYQSQDVIVEYMTDDINSNFQETDALTPCTVYELSPSTSTLYHKDDYPERFSTWFNQLMEFLT